jgi:hypothetical protein
MKSTDVIMKRLTEANVNFLERDVLCGGFWGVEVSVTPRDRAKAEAAANVLFLTSDIRGKEQRCTVTFYN